MRDVPLHPDRTRGKVQALKEELKAPGLSRAEFDALEAQIALLEGDLRHHSHQQQGREERERRDQAIARHEAWKAVGAKVEDQADFPALGAAITEKLHEIKPLYDAFLEKYAGYRSLITSVTLKSPDSGDQTGLLIESMFQTLANSGLPVYGYGVNKDARSPEDVVKLILDQVQGDLRTHGRRMNYLRPDFKPNADWKPE